MAELRACNERQLAATDTEQFKFWGRMSQKLTVEVERLKMAARNTEAGRISTSINETKGR